MINEVIEMYKYKCSCGFCIIFHKYTIHLEGTLTFRKYTGECSECREKIDTMDVNEDDLIEQEYLC